jgi:hypothetical protein
MLRRKDGRLRVLWRFMANVGGKGLKRLKAMARRARAIHHLARDRARKAGHLAQWHDQQVRKLLTVPKDKRGEIWHERIAHHREQSDVAWARHRKWKKARGIYHAKNRRLLRKIRKRQQAGGPGPNAGDYSPRLLNGNPEGPNGLDEKLKPVVVFQVLVCGQYVTDTYDCYCHATNSYHYPWKAADNQVHAVDTAGSDMAGAQNRTAQEFGLDYFAELLGPADWHAFNGQRISGTYSGHHNHEHLATPR